MVDGCKDSDIKAYTRGEKTEEELEGIREGGGGGWRLGVGKGGRVRHRDGKDSCCCWLVAQRPSNMLVYLRDGSAQTILRAATLR